MLLHKPANPINNFGSRQFDIIGSGKIRLQFFAWPRALRGFARYICTDSFEGAKAENHNDVHDQRKRFKPLSPTLSALLCLRHP
jgi:hypothetical protein